MKRRLALARGSWPRPGVLLLDEPFTGLDQRGRKWLQTRPAGLQGRRRHRGDGHAQLRPGARDRRPAGILAGGRLALDTPRGELSPEDVQRLYAASPRRGRRLCELRHGARWIVFWKDLLVERRSKEQPNALLFFCAGYSCSSSSSRWAPTATAWPPRCPALLWLGFILAGVLGLGRSFLAERENDCWEALLLAPGRQVGDLPRQAGGQTAR